MDEIPQEHISQQSGREPTLLLSPKRPRTDYTLTDGVKSRFDFPELLTLRKPTDISLSSSVVQENTSQMCILAECGDMHDGKPHECSQDTKLNIDPVTNVSHTDDTQTESSEVCFIATERHRLHVGKEEQVPVTETDRLSSNLIHDTSGTLTESHTLKDTSGDTSSHPDCKRLGKSIENEPPGGYSLLPQDDEDGRQVQNSVSQIHAVTLSSSDEDVRCQSDCSCEVVLTDEGCGTWSQSAGDEENNQREIQFELSEKTLFRKEKEEVKNGLAFSDFADCKSFFSKPEEYPSGNLAECGKNCGKTLELQIGENESVGFCDGEIKGQVNEDGIGKNLIHSAAECAEGSIGSYAVVLARNTETESSASLEVDDFCEAKGARAAGKMIAKIGSETADHTTEIPMPARISQEPGEGDNDAGSFNVIDPAIWSETDGEAEEKCCNSASTAAGVELSPSVKICEMETPLSFWSDVGPSQCSANELSDPDWIGQLSNQFRAQQCGNEIADLQSYTKRQTSVTTNKTHDKTGKESFCHWKSSASSSPHMLLPAGDERKESHGTVEHELKEQDQCESSVHLRTRGVAYSNREIARMDMTTEIKGREIRSFPYENAMQLEEELLQQNEKRRDTTEMSIGHCITDCTENEMSKCGDKLTIIEDENKLKGLCDHQYTTDISIIEGKDEGNERKAVERVAEVLETDEHGNGSERDSQQQCKADTSEMSFGECTGNWTPGTKLTLVSEDETVNKLNCLSSCQDTSEIFIAENEDDHSTSLPSNDAIVPAPPQDLVSTFHSQNTDNNLTARNCTDRFSPVPSAFTFCNRVPGGFDTFEKIQLTPDDDDAAGLGNSPLLASLPGQLLKTPERQLYRSMPAPQSDEFGERVEEEEEEEEGQEEVERYESHTENMANGFLKGDSSCNEVTNFISAADVIALGWPEQKPLCQSAYETYECFQDDLHLESSAASTESNSPASDLNDRAEFEMKAQFNLVLKELKLFFDISARASASSSGASSPERHMSELTEAPEGDSSNCKERHRSPEQGDHRKTSSDDADDDRSQEMCSGDLVVSCTVGSRDDEQEVPLSSHVCQEESKHPEQTHREPAEMEREKRMLSPSFMCLQLLEQLNHRLPEQPRRLEPLRTCTRPIRVGLSKRAKTKHLHRPHPYK